MKRVLLILFTLLYAAVAFVSLYHAISFFSLSNAPWLATVLSISFEIGQAAVLFSLLYNSNDDEKDSNVQIMPWILMVILTIVQVLGNVYSSYRYMIMNSSENITYFTNSVLFFIKNPDNAVNNVMISYITGAILPIIALCMTGMVVKAFKSKSETPDNNTQEAPKRKPGRPKKNLYI